MKNLLAVICLLLLLPAVAPGQERDDKTEGHGYFFAAPGVLAGHGNSMTMVHFGGGGEAYVYKGLGFGAEVGYLSPIEAWSEGVGCLSINGQYALRSSARYRVVPFISGGYSLLFRSGSLNAVNFGGGVNYWFAKRAGLRLEVRDHVSPEYFGDHLIQGRVGITLR